MVPLPAPLQRIDDDLKERFPDEPRLAHGIRFADTLLGFAEQLVLFSLLMFTVFVTVTSFVVQKTQGHQLEGSHSDIRYATFLIAMIGGAYAAHHRRLLSMDFVSHFLPQKVRTYSRLINTLFATFIAGLFAYFGWLIFDAQLTEMETRHPVQHWMPEKCAAAAILIGASLLVVHLLFQMVIDVTYLVTGKQPPEPTMGAA